MKKPKVFTVETKSGTVRVTVDPTGAGAFVSVGPLVVKPLGMVIRPVVWVPNVAAGLAALIPE